MIDKKQMLCAMISLLATSACTSKPSAPVVAKCPELPTPPAWVMESHPSSLTKLDELIQISEPASN